MTIALATAWNPRGELGRIERIWPEIREVYAGVVISLPPHAGRDLVEDLSGGIEAKVVITPDWSWGRHVALENALDLATGHIQYVDFDRLLRWVETNPQEWRRIVQVTQQVDCLIVGRTESAYNTHPQALVQTEAISNLVVSYLLGMQVDVSAGCKGFSRAAAEFLVAQCRPGFALGTDAEWPIRLQRAGFQLEYLEADGLDWEIPDQHQHQAADPQRQRQVAQAYDADPANWSHRVKVAREIVQRALNTYQRNDFEIIKD
jgi:hypothetical protein